MPQTWCLLTQCSAYLEPFRGAWELFMRQAKLSLNAIAPIEAAGGPFCASSVNIIITAMPGTASPPHSAQ